MGRASGVPSEALWATPHVEGSWGGDISRSPLSGGRQGGGELSWFRGLSSVGEATAHCGTTTQHVLVRCLLCLPHYVVGSRRGAQLWVTCERLPAPQRRGSPIKVLLALGFASVRVRRLLLFGLEWEPAPLGQNPSYPSLFPTLASLGTWENGNGRGAPSLSVAGRLSGAGPRVAAAFTHTQREQVPEIQLPARMQLTVKTSGLVGIVV